MYHFSNNVMMIINSLLFPDGKLAERCRQSHTHDKSILSNYQTNSTACTVGMHTTSVDQDKNTK